MPVRAEIAVFLPIFQIHGLSPAIPDVILVVVCEIPPEIEFGLILVLLTLHLITLVCLKV